MRTKTYCAQMTVNDQEDILVTVEYETVAASVGRTNEYGQKMEPDIPGRIEIGKCTLEDGREITPTTAQELALEEEINEWLHGYFDEDPPEGYHD